jgi:ArsR family transcriptional regulator
MNTTDAPYIFDHLVALSDPTRGRVLLVLDGHELTVSEIGQVLQLPQPTVSRHLKTLTDEGWLVARADGTSRRYALAAPLEAGAQELWAVVRGRVASTAAARHDAERLRAVLAARRTTSRAFFSSAAGEWDRLRTELFGGRVELVALLGLLDPGLVVGDLGCGTGAMTGALAPFVRRVVAVDASEEMLAAARARLSEAPNVELRVGDVEALPVADGELDAALLVLVLHHLAEPRAALAEAARALAPGGRLIVVDMLPHDRAEYRRAMGHVWQGFDEAELGAWLGEADFESFRYHVLPADTKAKGPTLFAASARKRGGAGPAPRAAGAAA